MIVTIIRFIINYLFVGILIYGITYKIVENGDKNGFNSLIHGEEMLDDLHKKPIIICIITLWPILILGAIIKTPKQ